MGVHDSTLIYRRASAEGVEPIVDGVQHRAVLTSKGRGFAVTLVPESESGPHMAKLGEDRYVKRSGDSFYTMEHFDIADMFGRRRKPKLTLAATVTARGDYAEFVIGLRNDRRLSARVPYLAFVCNRPFRRSQFGVDGNHSEGLARLQNPVGRSLERMAVERHSLPFDARGQRIPIVRVS